MTSVSPSPSRSATSESHFLKKRHTTTYIRHQMTRINATDNIHVSHGAVSRNLWNIMYTPLTLFSGFMPSHVKRTDGGAAAIEVTPSNTANAAKESANASKLIFFIFLSFFVLFLE